MSGSGGEKRHRVMAIRAAKLKRDGLTSRQIAEAIGKNPEQVKGIVLIGERCLSEVEEIYNAADAD